MKVPPNSVGSDLARSLSVLGYQIGRQSGSHMRLMTTQNGVYHLTIPHHSPLREGTLLGGILKPELITSYPWRNSSPPSVGEPMAFHQDHERREIHRIAAAHLGDFLRAWYHFSRGLQSWTPCVSKLVLVEIAFSSVSASRALSIGQPSVV